MKCIVLVGGYATRMYPLTVNFPKALLEINGTTVLDHLLQNVFSCGIIDEYILVTNDTFYEQFITWKKNNNYQEKITIVSDGSNSSTNKIGATSAVIKTIKDKNIDDDILIIAGDNILDFSLDYIFEDFINNDSSCVMFYEEYDKLKLSKTGVIELDLENYIISLEEKPCFPKTNYAVPPFYWLKKHDVKRILFMFDDTKKVDSLGAIIINLCKNTKIKAIPMIGKRYDIGSIEEYKKIIGRR